jgi:hypothetical protein
MLKEFTLGVALVAGAVFLVPATPTSAAPLPQPALLTGESAGEGLVQEARWRRRHRVCRRVCYGTRIWTPWGYECTGRWRTRCYWR